MRLPLLLLLLLSAVLLHAAEPVEDEGLRQMCAALDRDNDGALLMSKLREVI